MGADFGSIASIFRSTEQQLSAVPGLGPTKVKRLHATFSTCFFRGTCAPQAPYSRNDASVDLQNGEGIGGQIGDGTRLRQATQRGHRNSTETPRQGEQAGPAGSNGEHGLLAAHGDAREWLAAQEASIRGDDVDNDEFDDDFV
jgi:hypothetical protein